MSTPEPTRPTDEQLDEWRRLEQAADRGPWIASIIQDEDGDPWYYVTTEGGYIITNGFEPGNQEFIAAARTAVPALLTEVAQLRCEINGLRDTVSFERRLAADRGRRADEATAALAAERATSDALVFALNSAAGGLDWGSSIDDIRRHNEHREIVLAALARHRAARQEGGE